MGSKSMHLSIPITCKTFGGNKTIVTKVLLDTGAGGLFLDKKYATKHHIILHDLPNTITPRNVDGTLNEARQITQFTWVQVIIDKRKFLERLLVTNLGSSEIIFGLPWFTENNPQIEWKTGKIQLPKPDLDTTFLYLAKHRKQNKEVMPKEFLKLLKPEPEPTSPDWRKRRQNQGTSPLEDNPSKERITKASDEL